MPLPATPAPLHFAIVGAGALGSILAAYLRRGGHQVSVLARGRRADQLRRHGIVLRGVVASTTPCDVIDDPRALGAMDVMIVTVKAYDTEAAIGALQHVRPRTVFSLANGVIKNQQLQQQFGADSVIGCMADISGELLDDGSVVFTRNVGLHLGELDGSNSERLRQVVDAIHGSDIPTFSHRNIQTVEWSKYVGWMAVMAAAVLTRQETWKYLSDPNCARLIVTLAREASTLARALDIPLIDMSPIPTASLCSGSDVEAHRTVQQLGHSFRERAPTHRMSALQDLEHGRRLEVEETLGYAITQGNALGLPMPALTACYDLLAAIDRFNRDRAHSSV